MFEDFRKFVTRGNVLDMAVGIIIGAAFSTIVKSLVDDIIMPIAGKMTGGADFSDLFILLGEGMYDTLALAQEAGATTVNYGLFVNAVVAFLIVAGVLFFAIKGVNKMKREKTPPEPTEKECPHCLSRIPIRASKCAYCTSSL